ncbi:STAS domain-containing protein [Halobacillus litoralis]|uniref:STAS domain-containing protein n=1 Tax=Halobacillus litoralis TaxID=45668 RepID=UPI001CFC7E5C|nr:STAS domain-containing protein [Halobacillus litoralis]
MKRVERSFPLPHFTINKNFMIQTHSEESEKKLGVREHLLDFFDEESVVKIRKWVTPEVQKVTLEAHLKPYGEKNAPVPCDLHVKWDNDLHAEVLILTKDEQMEKVTKTMDQLRSRLNDTNFQLLEEKEKLEEAIQHANHLSAPFISLTSNTALVPLFGDITEEKMYTVESQLLHSSQQGDIDQILFDFTAVGTLEREGAQVLKNIMTSLNYMGSHISIVGVRPEQVKNIQAMQFPPQIQYINTLQQAIKKYCSE